MRLSARASSRCAVLSLLRHRVFQNLFPVSECSHPAVGARLHDVHTSCLQTRMLTAREYSSADNERMFWHELLCTAQRAPLCSTTLDQCLRWHMYELTAYSSIRKND